jgi:DNA-3-methyladenine glycosylase II
METAHALPSLPEMTHAGRLISLLVQRHSRRRLPGPGVCFAGGGAQVHAECQPDVAGHLLQVSDKRLSLVDIEAEAERAPDGGTYLDGPHERGSAGSGEFGHAGPPITRVKAAAANATLTPPTRGPSPHNAEEAGPRPSVARAARHNVPGFGQTEHVSDSKELPSNRVSYSTAARALADKDPVIARLVAETGLPRLGRSKQSHFASLVQAVVYQQLAGRAAAAIHGRLVAALDGDIEPEALLTLSDEALRSVGLSANKAASLRDLAAKIVDGTVVLTPRGLARQGDEELIEALSTVRGIGRWTAQMFLMFQLRRIDVWPTGDFGVRRGYGLAWEVPMPTARQLEPLGDPYRPYRSVAAWYCWRAAELYAGAASSAVTG